MSWKSGTDPRLGFFLFATFLNLEIAFCIYYLQPKVKKKKISLKINNILDFLKYQIKIIHNDKID